MTKEKEVLTDWVHSYTNDLYNWALHKVSNIELAQDLVQDTFLAAAEKIEGFKGESSPKTWLFSILNYKIIDEYRKKGKEIVHSESQLFDGFFDKTGGWYASKKPCDWQEEEKHLLDNSELNSILQKCIDALPEVWGNCVKLKYISEKKGDEICQEVGITSTNFWQIVHRAKLQLRECVETNWFHK